MKKVLAFRFISDRLPVLDVQYGEIVDGHFQPYDVEMYWQLDLDLHNVALPCEDTDILGTQILLKANSFSTVIRNLYGYGRDIVENIEIFPSFIVFHLNIPDHEQKKEVEDAR